MANPEKNNYSNDPNDALRREDDVENIHEISGDDSSLEHGKNMLKQADEASRPSYELNLDDLRKKETQQLNKKASD